MQRYTNSLFSTFLQVTCMLGLLYLTSVAGVIASSTMIHLLARLPSTSRTQLGSMEPTPIETPALLPNLSPDTPNLTSDLRCCTLTNDSFNPHAFVTGHPGSASFNGNSVLCLWSSIFSTLAYPNPSSHNQQQDCLDSKEFCQGFTPLQCCGRNNTTTDSSPWYNLLTAPWFGFAPVSDDRVFPDPHLSSTPPFQRHPCCPETTLPFGKSQSLLMPG